METMREITSINLRVARQVQGCAMTLAEELFSGGLCSCIIAGPPASGKTTLLRDLARILSSGFHETYCKTVVVDERGELAAVSQGLPGNDLGPCCDVLTGFAKAEGILRAVRTLSPQVIFCDEIGSLEEVQAIEEGLGCGVHVILTLHGGSMEELLRRPQAAALRKTGAFERVALLGSDPFEEQWQLFFFRSEGGTA